MKRLGRGSAAGLAVLALGAPLPAQVPPGPEAADTVAGVVLADPHRRLERWDDPEVRAWLKAEDADARAVLEAVPTHDAILDRILELSAVDQFSVPLHAGRARIHLVVDGETDERRLVWSDGARERDLDLAVPTRAGSTLSSFAVSPDGARLAVEWTDPASGTTELTIAPLGGASDGPVVRVRGAEVTAGAWLADGTGLLVTRRGSGDRAADTLFQIDPTDPVASPEPVLVGPGELPWRMRPHAGQPDGPPVIEVTADGRSLLAVLGPDDGPLWTEAPTATVDAFDFVGWREGHLLVRTGGAEGQGRIVRIDPRRAAPAEWTTVLVPPEGLALREAHLFGDRILAHVQEGPRPVLRIHDADDGRVLHSLEVPFGLIWTDYLTGWSAFSGQPDHPEAYFRSINLTAPGIYRIDMETGRVEPWRLREIGVDPEAFTVRADAYRSRDGTRVPIVLVSRRDREGVPSPTLVYAYGAYGFTPVPFFNARYLTWVEDGGTLAIPYLRGGGVFGDGWHRAGSGPDKMRTIEDLIAAARWLVETGVADPSSLAVEGQSPGGTVAAASALLEPGLWSAVLLETPVADPVRDQLLSGRRASEFGRVEEPAELEAMLGFAPYRLVRPGIGHPPMLLRTAERDRAVPPWHAAKLLAALREADAGAGGELLLRIEWDGGHFLAGRERRAREWAADLAFLARHVGWPEG